MREAGDIGKVTLALSGTVEGEPNRIAFNAAYLKQLGSLFDGDFTLAWTRPSEQGVAKPVEGGTFRHVLMPMFVQW